MENLLKEVEEEIKNYGPKKRKDLISYAIRLGYKLEDVKEGTVCILKGIRITVIPRHNIIQKGTSRSILVALFTRNPNRPFRGQMM